MKVGIVCPYSWDMPGGVKQHIDDLTQALAAQGHEVSVIAPAADDDELPPYVTGAGRAVPVPYNGSVARMSFGFLSAARVRRWVRTGEFDVLHIHEPLIPSLGVLACWAAKGPIVATFHASFSRSRAIAVAEPLLRSALEKLTGRIAVSDAARKSLVEQFGGDAVLIPNGVTVARYARAEPLEGWGPDGRTIGFLGRMDEERKGLPILLEAFAALADERPEVRLLVAGPGDEKDVYERVPGRFHDRVTVLGMVSEADKIRAYHSVDVFCAPNTRGESFGIVLAEAMASGATVLASDIPAFRKVLGDGQAGALFANGDPASLAREAGALLDAPERRAALAEEALRAVRKYDWSTVARDVVRVYETVTASGAGRVEEDL
ncbi:GDP-mannose-dependent alpha-(1-2)-phosphatidylinositol mannosyltransferase [Nonomuraea coxensis DSM 45129]|uniref:GDP-mannose-dependent alpha-(1-2)-phosphatidylinositol mannosyltransferase n=1 Tax=Nonomuraea coxensis DSM 45129 TaxID=1122611 RepID=A0ABX8U8V8_9ACTN|nr:glycosyltransferase family 4 protein [Nonomuraea coxensis]QYC43107.1 GDP-mannose-dependent alpha-(1-2)-phosphatidylinositol mannosyltransferase [Nonomuraea coxensis DSM 45129]